MFAFAQSRLDAPIRCFPHPADIIPSEHGGQKLYVPIENPVLTSVTTEDAPPPISSSPRRSGRHRHRDVPPAPNSDELMQVDDSKHKVYIYNIDDELSSESEPEDANNGKLVFLPDIEKHLKANRIPPHVLSDPRAEMAGKELVLYSVPRSISVPQEHDSVRKAIIEARARAREKQNAAQPLAAPGNVSMGAPTAATMPGLPAQDLDLDAMSEGPINSIGGVSTALQPDPDMQIEGVGGDTDSDAMDLD
jgi:hypothetical protein